MANMGVSTLVVVAPRCDIGDAQAVSYAAHGRPVLDGARTVGTLGEALEGCVASFATTARAGLYRRQANLAPAAAARRALERAASGEVAFVFGPEHRGLTNQELLEVDHVVTIPAADAYPVLNLAAAVMVVCYELRTAWLEGAPASAGIELAPDERKAAMYRRLFEALDRVGFFFGPNPDHLKYALRHLFGRVGLTVNECDILTGMARQILWYVEHHPPGTRGTG